MLSCRHFGTVVMVLMLFTAAMFIKIVDAENKAQISGKLSNLAL
jgi:hypothetical protein